MHFLNPVAETIYDHSPDDWMICVERIAGTGVVGISGAVLFQDVVCAVVNSSEAQHWTVVVAFRGMVEDDVQNDFDARAV